MVVLIILLAAAAVLVEELTERLLELGRPERQPR